MARLYVPTAVAVVLLVLLTWKEAQYSDRFRDSSVSAIDFENRFARVPKEIGNWKGKDLGVTEEVLEVAGAVSHVNRSYTNEETGETVDLWLIVGHSRDICRHTPDICYPSQGFAPIGTPVQQEIQFNNGEKASFNTAKYRNESPQGLLERRVFWSWNANREDQRQWEAPEPGWQRLHFGNNQALYKLYFTYTITRDGDQITKDNPAVDFAKLMLPEINRALFEPESASSAPAGATAAEPAASTEPPAAEAVLDDASGADASAAAATE